MSSLKLEYNSTTHQYTTSGTRISNPISLSNTDGNYALYWESYAPFNTYIKIETCISSDGGTTWTEWTEVVKNQPIPDIPENIDLSSISMKIKQTLTTHDTSITPELYTVQIFALRNGNSNEKDSWADDNTQILAKLKKSLDAGNVDNKGIKIIGFQIKRREKNKLNTSCTIGTVYYNEGDAENKQFEFTDITQPNKKLVYSILPIGENGLIGSAKEIDFESNFTGWWIVDKYTDNVLGFDKAVGSVGDVETSFAQDRTVIETFSKYGQVYYNSKEGHSFTLSASFLPSEGERSGEIYERLLDNFIRQHKPFLVKGSNGGKLFVCDISNPRVTSPQNTWTGHDYITISVDCLEIMELSEYMSDTE